MTETPWLTVKDAAAHARRSVCTIQRACREYELSGGKRGLKNEQPTVPNGMRFTTAADVDRWIKKQPPARDAVRRVA